MISIFGCTRLSPSPAAGLANQHRIFTPVLLCGGISQTEPNMAVKRALALVDAATK